MYDYIRFTSKNAPSGGKSLFTINLPQTIVNATSCHVKSFSMPNTAYNIQQGANSFEWYETVGNSNGDVVLLQSSLTPKFYTIADLINTMDGLMTTASVAAKTAGSTLASLTYTMSQIDSANTVSTYHIELSATINAGGTNGTQKKFVPKVYKGSVWAMLGFPETFQAIPNFFGRVSTDLSVILNPITTASDTRFTTITLLVSGSSATKTAEFAPRDSHESYHIISSLASAVYEAEADGVVKHTNYLLTVPNTSNRYSWIQYTPTEPIFHDLLGVNLNQFTIGLADEDGYLMNNDEHQEFSVVIAIEYQPQHGVLNTGQLQTLAWRQSHCPKNIF